MNPRVISLNHPNKFPIPATSTAAAPRYTRSLPPPDPRAARPARAPPGKQPLPAPHAPPRVPLPLPAHPRLSPGGECLCVSERVCECVRVCVCARVKAEVGEKRRHLLLPGLAVGRDGAAVTLAFAVHACAESSSHCHAPVNPSQPPREQPRPHGDPRSYPHYWPPHAKAPPPSPRQRMRLTGLPPPSGLPKRAAAATA